MDYPYDEYYEEEATWDPEPQSEAVAGWYFPLPQRSVGFALPLISIFLISAVLAFFALRLPVPKSILSSPPAQAVLEAAAPLADALPQSTGQLAALFTPEVRYWESAIVQWAQAFGLDPNLVATVMQIESCGDPQAVSSSGAMGLFQVMPFHFNSGEDTFDPHNNAIHGIEYLKKSLEAHSGDARSALAGYNAGITGSQRPENMWPAETLRYVKWGYGIYMDALAGKTNSETLQEWLNAGGEGLCASARSRQGQ